MKSWLRHCPVRPSSLNPRKSGGAGCRLTVDAVSLHRRISEFYDYFKIVHELWKWRSCS